MVQEILLGVILTPKFNSKWRVNNSKAEVILTPQTELSLLTMELFLL